MPLRPNMGPGDFLDILRRKKWVIIFSFLIILFVALVYCVIVPDLYESSTKILIIPPAVAEGMVRSTVNLSTQERLATIEADVLGRPRLLGVIHAIGIQRLGFTRMPENDMLSMMRERIELDIDRKRNREGEVNTFVLSFLHENPKVAQEVASTLSTLFIGENIKLRENVTQETTKFLDTQLEETRVRLEQQEERIKQYKIHFIGELPQQEQSNQNRLQRLSDQIKNNADSIARMQDRKLFLETQIAALIKSRNEAAGSGAGDEGTVPAKLLTELSIAKKKLEAASRKYTALHPAVVQARWEVDQAEARIAEARAANAGGSEGSPSAGPSNSEMEIGEVKRLQSQIAKIDLEIGALQRESAGKSALIDEIQRKVERLPQREQEIVALTRDYDNLKKSYEELLNKRLKANISMNLEENQKGERFQVLEPASLPSKPSKPDRLKVLMLALAACFGVGIGGAIGIELLDPKLKGSKEFKSLFDLPVLASLPLIQNEEYMRKFAMRKMAIRGGMISIAAAYVIFLMMYGPKIKSIVNSIATNIGG